MPMTPRQNTSSAIVNQAEASFTHTPIVAKKKAASTIQSACMWISQKRVRGLQASDSGGKSLSVTHGPAWRGPCGHGTAFAGPLGAPGGGHMASRYHSWNCC